MFTPSKVQLKSLLLTLKANYSAKLGPMQKIIMLCGAPGVGKGMFSRFLADDFGYVKVSTGDEIRKILNGYENPNISTGTVKTLKDYVNSGRLVPDNIIMEVLYQKIKEPGSSRGIILDGFPRTVNQLKMFNEVFPIHLVVNIEERHDYIMASLLGRRTCMDCGMSYSAYSYYKDGYELDVQMPVKKGVCDCCGGEVKTREDDKEEIVKARLKEYKEKTYPLLKKLKEDGNLMSFEPKRGERDYPKLQQLIVSQLGLPYYYYQKHTQEFNLSWYYN